MSTSLEAKVHKYALTLPKQLVGQADLQSYFPHTSLTDIGQAINNLSRKNLIRTMDMGKSGIKWQAVTKAEAKKLASLDDEEGLVYRAIEQAGRDAIWTMHIRAQTNLHQTVVNKVLKALEGRNEIKAVKSIKFPTRKLYMLFHLQPSVEMTGGPWFTDNELDTEFIKQLLQAVLSFIKQRSFPKVKDAVFPPSHTAAYPTASQIATWIKKAQISTTELDVSHVRVLLDVLEFDGEIQALPAVASGEWRDKIGKKERGGGGGKSKSRRSKEDESDVSEDSAEEDRRARKRKKAKLREMEKERRRKAERKKRKAGKAKRRKGKGSGTESESQSGTESESDSGSESESEDERKKSRSKSKSRKPSSSRSSKKSSSSGKKRRSNSSDVDMDSSSDSNSDPSDALEHDSDSSDDAADRRRRRKLKAKKAKSRSRSRSKSVKGSDDDDEESLGLPSDADSIDRDVARRKKRKERKRVEVELSESDDESSDGGRKSRKGKKGKGKAREESEEEEEEEEEKPDLEDLEDDEGDMLVYRAIKPEKVSLGWTEAPCGRCPVFSFCKEGGPIDPDGCTYYDEWLDQTFG